MILKKKYNIKILQFVQIDMVNNNNQLNNIVAVWPYLTKLGKTNANPKWRMYPQKLKGVFTKSQLTEPVK